MRERVDRSFTSDKKGADAANTGPVSMKMSLVQQKIDTDTHRERRTAQHTAWLGADTAQIAKENRDGARAERSPL